MSASGLVLLAGVTAAGCHRPSTDTEDVVVEWKMTPTTPAVGHAAVGELTLLDRSHRPLLGATVQMAGHMRHPGMAPVIEPAHEQGGGLYVSRLSFPMSGAWDLSVTASLRDGRSLRRRVGEATVGPG